MSENPLLQLTKSDLVWFIDPVYMPERFKLVWQAFLLRKPVLVDGHTVLLDGAERVSIGDVEHITFTIRDAAKD